MKSYTIILLALAAAGCAMSQHSGSKKTRSVEREHTEWCDIWIPHILQTDKPRILLAGDSITSQYYASVCRLLEGKGYCARFATSASVAEPAFHAQLEAVFSQNQYAVIHFNNGLHGFGYTEEEYRAGYERALRTVRKQSPSSTVVLALSTPLNPESPENHLNPRIAERNRIVRELAKAYGAEINDLHTISKGHPEHYSDAYHFQAEAIELQSRQVAGTVEALLCAAHRNSLDAE